MPKNVQTTTQLCSFHMQPKLCSKFFKLGLSSTWTENLKMYKQGLEKIEEPEMKLPTSAESQKKQKNSRKTSILLHWLRESLWLCGSQQTVENSLTDGNTRPPHLVPAGNISQGSLNKGYLIRLAWARRSAKCSFWFFKNMHNHVKVLRKLQWRGGTYWTSSAVN